MIRRWGPFVAACIASVIAASAAGLAGDHMSLAGSQSPAHLGTISTATLSRLGITLSSGAQPPYCDVAATPVLQNLLQRPVGCAISQAAAETAARGGGAPRVVESLLARVTASRLTTLGSRHLTWLVVLQSSYGTMFGLPPCRAPAGSGTVCLANRSLLRSQLVLVDALSATVLTTFNLSPVLGGWGRGHRFRPGIAIPD